MLVRISAVNCGYVARPVSDRIAKRYARHMHDVGQTASAEAFAQERLGEWAEWLPRRAVRDLEAGWSVTVRLDSWVFGHWLGYDAHNVGGV